MNYEKASQAYRNDPVYHQFVDVMINAIETLEFSPSELREAAMFACILREERNPCPVYVVERESFRRKNHPDRVINDPLAPGRNSKL